MGDVSKIIRSIAVLSWLIVLSACAPSQAQIDSAVATALANLPTQTAYPTYTLYPTHTMRPPIVRVITATPKPTQAVSPTASNTLGPSRTPAPTQDPLTANRGAGFYLVGVDIAPGVWRSLGTSDDCYWALTSKTGDILKNHYGMAGGTAYVAAGAYQVEFGDGCGSWTYLGQ